jgi:hypothetical protein
MLITTRYIVLVLVVLLVVYLAFLDQLAKPLFESQASELYGGEVTVDSLSISPFLGRVTLYELQVANRSNPMRNLADAERVLIDIDMVRFANDVIDVQALEIEGLVLFRSRQEPARIIRPLIREGSEIDRFGLPDFEWPDPDALVSRQRQQLDRDIAEISEAFASGERKWQLKMSGLPTRQQLDQYRQRIEQLRLADRPEQRAEVSAQAQEVYAEISSQVETFQDLRQEFRDDLAALRETVARADALPAYHAAQLIDSLGLSNSRTAQLGSRLLRGDVSGIVQQIMVALTYTGTVAAHERDPLYIHTATLSGTLLPSAVGLNASGELKHFAWPLDLAAEPTTLELSGDSPNGGSLQVSAKLDHRDAGADDVMTVTIDRLPLSNMRLSGSEKLQLTLEQGLATAQGELRLLGVSLSGMVTQRYEQVQFKAELADDAGDAARLIAGVLQRNQDYEFQVGLNGTLESPRMQFAADMDRRIQDTVRDAIAERLTELTSGLQNRISREIGPLVAEARQTFEQLSAMQAELEESLVTLNGLAPPG